MTTLYKPVLIESVEQAEALPDGTIITHAEYHPQEKFAGLWGRDRNTSGQLAQQDGWTALVPIEAEECHSEDYGSYHLMEGIDGPKPFTAYLVDREEA